MKKPVQHVLIFIFSILSFAASAQQASIKLELDRPVLPAGEKQTVHVKVSLRGPSGERREKRPPVNIALVLDRSGSMKGRKIEQAREAAVAVLDYLDSRDIVSVIAYDSTVEVLLPATKVSDKALIAAAVRRLQPRDSTALYAGVSKGADEVRKFLEKGRVNRVILLSDGLANVGPDSPEALGSLGARLGEEGIAVTTLGLGLDYNEDLMARLARRSDGNHAFVENAKDLSRIFALEFGDILSVAAQEIDITITCGDGVRPLRIFGRDADISGRRVRTRLNQLYAEQEKYLLLELEVPAETADKQQHLLQAEVVYLNMLTQQQETLTLESKVRYSDSTAEVEKALNKEVRTAVVEQIALERSKEAVKLRDAGKLEEAEAVLDSNAGYLAEEAEKLASPRLREQSKANAAARGNLRAPEDWARQRKQMRKDQHTIETQQSY